MFAYERQDKIYTMIKENGVVVTSDRLSCQTAK